jgi:hypothetical protein
LSSIVRDYPTGRILPDWFIKEVEHAMLAEKYILLLETLRSMAERSPAYADGAPKVISTSPHVPVELTGVGGK